METGGIRDLERLEERDDEGPGRRVATLLLAALATVGLVFAMALLLGRAEPVEASAVEDPLAAFDLREEADAVDRSDEDRAPLEVDREALAFPETLGAYDSRPEVEAALAAAAAEVEHPDPIPAGMALGDAVTRDTIAPAPPTPVDDSLPDVLPAGSVVGSGPEVIERHANRDPLVAAALPAPSSAAPVAAGHDGEYTVQVVSYQSADEAEMFASALRERGHSAFVMSADIPNRGRYYRVRIGPFENAREAEAYRHTFEAEERMSTIVVRQRE